MAMRLRRCAVSAALVALLSLAGLVAAIAGATGAAHAQPADAYVRVAQGTATERVDVYLDSAGTPILAGLHFGAVTAYAPLAAGLHEIDVTAAGHPLHAAFISRKVSLVAGHSYTLALTGDSNSLPTMTLFLDDNTVASDMGKLRFYHLSSDAGIGTISIDGQPVLSGLTFLQSSGYLTLPPGAYRLSLVLLNGGISLPLTVSLGANEVTSIFAMGQVAGMMIDVGRGATSGGTAFRFVPATVAGLPTTLPQTGFAPRGTALAGGMPLGLAIGVVVLVALGMMVTVWGPRPAGRDITSTNNEH